MYEKILVPIDGSDYSIRALCEAINLAKLTGGALTLIHVTPSGSSVVMSSKQHFYDILHQEGKQVLSNRMKLAEEEGIKTETLLLHGDPVDQIVKTAKQGNFSLIVMGARGVSKLTGLVVGSVSQGVIKNAPCPVLVTR
jgi:nucleotide-binding universal stress UspA family protein